jgi:diguanylate cyclase (GGDEF)-like protein
MYVDLDNFKSVNDTLGRALGDHALKEAAKRMTSIVRYDDTVARLGGDEFLILLANNVDSSDRIELITSRLLNSFKEPIVSNDHEFVVTISIGISISPVDGIDANQLLRNADLAMYQSKRMGKNTYHYFTENLSLDLERRHLIEKCLLKAITNNEFHVVYQPIILVNDRSLRGAEALLRWNSNDLGAIDVTEFIAIAEQIGFIHRIGEFVLDQALEFAQKVKNEGHNDFKVSINVSPIQILKQGFIDVIKKYLGKYNLPGKTLEIEITEGVL